MLSFLDGVTPPAEVAGPSKMVQLLQGIDDYLVPYGKLSAMHTTCKRDGRTLFRLLINNFNPMENILKGERVEEKTYATCINYVRIYLTGKLPFAVNGKKLDLKDVNDIRKFNPKL